MYIGVLIYALLFIIQFSLSLYSWQARGKLKLKYSKILGSMIEVEKTIEKIINLNNKFKAKVTYVFEGSAKAGDRMLYVNKESMYKNDLLSNYFLLFEYFLTNKNGRIARNFRSYQNILFFMQFLLFIAGLILNSNIGLILIFLGISLEITLIITSIFVYYFSSVLEKNLQQAAVVILELDNVEEARADRLKKDLLLRFFEYPITPIWGLFQFLKP